MTDLFYRGVQHAALRATNRRAVLSAITNKPGITNADISRQTGLAPQTVSAIVTELDSEGLVGRGEVLRGRRGQPATPLYVNREAGFAIGCNVDWQHLHMGLIDLGGHQVARYRRDYPFPDARTIVEEIADVARTMLDRLDTGQRRNVVGMGLASPAHLARYVHLVDTTGEQAALWTHTDLARAVGARTGLPTRRYSDGNCGCWAEAALTPPPRRDTFTYLYVGTFLGAGYVSNHVVWEGPTGASANPGSLLVAGPDGERRSGHSVASIYALRKRLRDAGVSLPDASPQELPWLELDAHVGPWLESCAAALAEIIMSLVILSEIELTVIDGDLPRDILERVVSETGKAIARLPAHSARLPRLAAGTLGADAVMLGAAHMPLLRKFFESDLRELQV